MKQCQKFHFLRCVIGLGRSYLHKDAHTQTRTWRERDPYVHMLLGWSLAMSLWSLKSKFLPAAAGQTLLQIKLWKALWITLYAMEYHTKPALALATYQNWGKIGIQFWSVSTHRIFTARKRISEESVRITENPRFICIRKHKHNPIN